MIPPLEIYLCPKKVRKVLQQKARYKVLYGGRASSKSWSVARYLVVKAAFNKLRILCTREMQNSIKDSVYRLLVDQIHNLKLEPYFIIQADGIRGIYGSEFLFKGLRHNISEIKSTEGVDIVWCEEAEKISEDSWVILIPTIRKENSEILITFNPELEKSPTYQRFVLHPPDDCISQEVNYLDNPHFTDVLRKEMEYCKRVDYDAYLYIWMGKLKKYSEALIFANKFSVEEFDIPPEVQFYYGADFGYSVDALWVGRCFIHNKCLYISDEVYGVGIEVSELHKYFEKIPDAHKWTIRADSARPDTINFLSQPARGKDGIEYKGFNIVGAEKGKGSVEDGIEFIRGFEHIYIHPGCQGAKTNFENYRWKQDKITNEILPIPVDKNNHAPDGIRYALEPYIKKKVSIWDVL